MQKVLNLIDKCLVGDQKAERALYDQYKTRWYMLSLRYSNSRDEANDILQEGLIQVYKDLHQFNSDKASFSTWSSKVVVHAALKYLKKSRWQNEFTDIENVQKRDNSDLDVYNKFATEELMRIIQNLPLGYRVVFNMNVIEGYSHIEIAKELGISVGTSKSQLSKAKQKLRTQLENHLKLNSNG